MTKTAKNQMSAKEAWVLLSNPSSLANNLYSIYKKDFNRGNVKKSYQQMALHDVEIDAGRVRSGYYAHSKPGHTMLFIIKVVGLKVHDLLKLKIPMNNCYSISIRTVSLHNHAFCFLVCVYKC